VATVFKVSRQLWSRPKMRRLKCPPKVWCPPKMHLKCPPKTWAKNNVFYWVLYLVKSFLVKSSWATSLSTAPRRDGDGSNNLVLLHVISSVIRGVPWCRSPFLSLSMHENSFSLLFMQQHTRAHDCGLSPQQPCSTMTRRCCVLPPWQRRRPPHPPPPLSTGDEATITTTTARIRWQRGQI
jgi:hypothetical protein